MCFSCFLAIFSACSFCRTLRNPSSCGVLARVADLEPGRREADGFRDELYVREADRPRRVEAAELSAVEAPSMSTSMCILLLSELLLDAEP